MIKRTVKRNDKVAFMGVNGGDEEYIRMRGFTEFSISKNPIEYTRKYIDEKNEITDVVGYAPSVRYSFDQINGDFVHNDFCEIATREWVGEYAARAIVIVDMSSESAQKEAIWRVWTIVPDAEGEDENTYTFSGTLRASSDIVYGTATSDDNWRTCKFVSADGEII